MISVLQPSVRESCSSLLLLLLQNEIMPFCVGCFSYHFKFNKAACLTCSCSLFWTTEIIQHNLGGVSWECFPEELKRIPKQERLVQDETPSAETHFPCVFTYGLQISRAALAHSAGAIACLLSSLASVVLEARLKTNLCHCKATFTYVDFNFLFCILVYHFQWPICAALCLRHGLFSLVQNDQEWTASSIAQL